MRALLCTPTFQESMPLRHRLAGSSEEPFLFQSGRHECVLFTTGIGMVNTALHVSRMLATEKPDIAILFGVAGSYHPDILPGEVVEVQQEIYGEMGAQSPEGFIGMSQIGFPLVDLPERGIRLFNHIPNPSGPATVLRQVTSLTCNTISGDAEGIAQMRNRWNADTENMEGAAFFQCCIEANVPFVELRGISNRVEPRNRAAWKLQEAIEAVNAAVYALMKEW